MKYFHLSGFVVLLFCGYKASSQNTMDKDSIRAYTQQLLDGIALGDTTAWSKYLDDSCIITSEDGSVKTKEQFIQGIRPLQSPFKVNETISNPIFRGSPHTIIFIYTAYLSVKLYEQIRANEICQTDTWLKTNKGWKLISNEALDKPEMPISQNPNQNIITNITGEYKLSDEYDIKIFTRNAKLYIQRNNNKEHKLKCETGYTYFTENQLLIRYIFIHNENGKIIKMINRRAGKDIFIPKIN